MHMQHLPTEANAEAQCWLLHAGHESWVLSVSCHPSGNAFATGSSDAKVKLWNLSTRSLEQTANEHSDQVCTITFRKLGHVHTHRMLEI